MTGPRPIGEIIEQILARVVRNRSGFADLLDFHAPPLKIELLPPGSPTAIGMQRTGDALREAIAAFEKAKLR